MTHTAFSGGRWDFQEAVREQGSGTRAEMWLGILLGGHLRAENRGLHCLTQIETTLCNQSGEKGRSWTRATKLGGSLSCQIVVPSGRASSLSKS